MSSGVQFEEDNFMGGKPAAAANQSNSGPSLGYGRPQPLQNKSKMTEWLLKHGVKSEHSAQVVLFVIIGINILVTLIVIKYFLF